MSLLYLIRHGQASFKSADYDRLSPLGERQAEVLAGHLVRRGVRFDAVVSGAKTRQIETARIQSASMHLDPAKNRVLPGLNEHDTFAIIGNQIADLVREDPAMADDVAAFYQDAKAFRRVFRKAMLRWMSGLVEVEGVETYADFLVRVRDALDEAATVAGDGGRVAVVSSGGPISTALKFAMELSDPVTLELDLEIHNTSWSVFKAAPGRLRLVRFNSAAHLEEAGGDGLLTYL